MSFTVKYFREPRPGPEAVMETHLVSRLPEAFPETPYPRWAAGSLPVGAGLPDLLIISCNPQVFALTDLELPHSDILAYLKAVGCARFETIVERVKLPRKRAMRCLDILAEARAVSEDRGVFSMVPLWRNILPEIIAVEVKVQDWRKALDQAMRNSLFAHRTYAAMPAAVANRIKAEAVLRKFGVGLLAVEADGEITVVRRAPYRQPRVWTYYYQLACRTAQYCEA